MNISWFMSVDRTERSPLSEGQHSRPAPTLSSSQTRLEAIIPLDWMSMKTACSTSQEVTRSSKRFRKTGTTTVSRIPPRPLSEHPCVVGIDDRLADADGDLFSNCAEWIAGKNPLLSTSRPTGTTITRASDGSVLLHYPCEPGKLHQLEYSDDLQNWKPMGIPSTSALRSFTARFPAPTLSSQRYYRLRSTL